MYITLDWIEVVLAEIDVFFGVNFILQKFCLCKKNDKNQECARAGCVTFNKLLGALVHWLQINYSYWRMLIAGGEKYGVHGGEGNTSNLVWRCGCSSTL